MSNKFKKIIEKFSFEKFLTMYTAILTSICETLKVTTRFISSVFNLFVNSFSLDLPQMLKLIVLLTFYSKLIIIMSSAISIPPKLLVLANEYYGVLFSAFAGVSLYIKEL